MGWHRVLAFDDLPEDRPVLREAGGVPVLLVRVGWDVVATHGLCPHKFTPLDEGQVQDGQVACALHGATFDLHTGEPAPGCEWAGRLRVLSARVRDGHVEVEV